MHKQMIGLVPITGKIHFTELYGYATKGIPGLEIVGLGPKGKAIKEKFIFLCKKYGFKVPPRRYVLCVDDSISTISKDEQYRWLELPLLILYWSMAGVLPIQNLTDCLCAGRISTRGKIEAFDFRNCSSELMGRLEEADLKLITTYNDSLRGLSYFIPLEEIIKFPK